MAQNLPATCLNQAAHTPHPTTYLGHSAWAEQMLLTHDQHPCPACGVWAVWLRKPGVDRSAPAIADGNCSRCGTYYAEGALIRTDGNGGWIASACCPRHGPPSDAAHGAVIDSPAVQASGHHDGSDRPPDAATTPPAPHPAITTDHRNEDT